MRILMPGNSFTFFRDIPRTPAQLLGAEVEHHTRGGAHLAEQLNPAVEMGARTLAARVAFSAERKRRQRRPGLSGLYTGGGHVVLWTKRNDCTEREKSAWDIRSSP